jgi:heme-degrading monooxygenase HmoA
MITEIATIRIRPETASDWEAAFVATSSIFGRARGCQKAQLLSCVEDPSRYVIQVSWATVEDHTVAFEEDGLLNEFVAAVAQYFDETPEVLHYSAASPEIP